MILGEGQYDSEKWIAVLLITTSMPLGRMILFRSGPSDLVITCWSDTAWRAMGMMTGNTRKISCYKVSAEISSL